MDKEQGNKLIAEFDGWKRIEDFINSDNEVFPHWVKGAHSKIKNEYRDILIGKSYHSDWNWLMRCVEKIEGLNFEVCIFKNTMRICLL